MTEPLEPLPADIQAMLDSERRAPQVTPGFRDQLRVRLQSDLPTAWAMARPLPPPMALPRAPLARWLLPLFFLGGLATGMALQELRTPRPVPPPIAPASERSLPPPAPPTLQMAPAAATPAPTPPLRRPKTAPTPLPAPVVARSDADLTAETALLERVRSALARQQSGEALAALEEHLNRFPSGRLSEEREALRVQALVQAGQGMAARSQAARFRSQYPESLLQPAVDAAIRSIP